MLSSTPVSRSTSAMAPGLLESVYEEILCYELRKQGFHVLRQQWIDLRHEELYIKRSFRADVIVNREVLVEIKSVRGLDPEYYKTVLTYLKLTKIEIGILVNFNVPLLRNGIRRVINTQPGMDH
jgi:GxxExxY protein